MRDAGRINAMVFQLVGEILRPGITTGEIDARAEALIRGEGAKPSFKGYRGFKGSICASLNEEIVHGVPGDRVLEEGDLLTVDVGVHLKGYHADAARSFPVGEVAPEVERLALATAASLEAGIQAARVGNRISDIATAVEAVGRDGGFGIIEEYVGHGIGTQLHEEPQVPNFVSDRLLNSNSDNVVLKSGLVLAIEPMFTNGTIQTETLSDRWTVVTADRSCSAHFEDTVAITEDGPVILTRPEDRQDIALWPTRSGQKGE